MKVAVCLFVRNEEANILEWLAYHLAVGFDALLVYDNLSTDNTPGVLRAAAKHGDIRIRTWRETGRYAQILAYNNCLLTSGREFDWILFIDSDEFFVPERHGDAKAMLGAIGDCRAVAVNMAFFGSSGHDAAPEGLVIENFTWRAPTAFDPNQLTKSFVRPGAALCLTPHYFPGIGAYLGPSGAPALWSRRAPGRTRDDADFDVCRVNHYFTRSRAHWRAKIRRGYRDVVRDENEFHHYDRNDIRDETALRFAPATRAKMTELTGGSFALFEMMRRWGDLRCRA
jgi:glycosyltransferase involved in cell wall biosynthesis